MDKTKVLIVGSGPRSRWMANALGVSGLFDIEHKAIGEKIHGLAADVIVTDFADLEKKMMAHLVRDGYVGCETLYDGNSINVQIRGLHDVVPTGRLIKDDPAFQELPGVREEHAKARAQVFLGQPQQIPRKPEKSRLFSAPYMVKQRAADHPSRKREPKGPRGKWNKL